eukprot:22413-Lingulodinium_polyedra.AAC.1
MSIDARGSATLSLKKSALTGLCDATAQGCANAALKVCDGIKLGIEPGISNPNRFATAVPLLAQ